MQRHLLVALLLRLQGVCARLAAGQELVAREQEAAEDAVGAQVEVAGFQLGLAQRLNITKQVQCY